MVKRYRYSFTKKKESARGKASVGTAFLSAVLFVLAVVFAVFAPRQYWFVTGGICLFASLVAIYGFIVGLAGFMEKDTSHNTCIFGAIANGLIMIFWLGMFLGGL